MSQRQTPRRQANIEGRYGKELVINRKGKDLEIEFRGIVFPAKWTARSSLTDSQQIPIGNSAIKTLLDNHPDPTKVALLYTWIEESGAVFAISLTVSQHLALTQEKIQAPGTESLAFTQASGGYYIRRHSSRSQWEQYCDLAAQGKILFALEIPSPIVYTSREA